VAELSEPPGSARRGAAVSLRAVTGVLVLLAGCSSLLGIEDLSGPAGSDPSSDAGGSDGGSGSGSGGMGHLTVRGSVHDGGPGQPGVATTVELVRPDGTVAATTTSDGAGAFALPVDFPGASIDVAVHAVGGTINDLDEYLVFGAPLTTDRSDANLALLSLSQLQSLAAVTGTVYDKGSAFLDIIVQTAGGQPTAGAQLVVDQFVQGVYYLDVGGQPNPQLAATSSSGGIYAFDAKPGVTTFRTNGLIAAGPRAVRLVAEAVFLIELRP
jgi:hypothetical protein